MTAQQDIFKAKPKDVISPLTPATTAAAIRAKYAKPEPKPPEALDELEQLAGEVAAKRTITRTKK